MDIAELPQTIPAMLARTVAEHGKNDAILMARDAVTYEELDRRTAKMARALLAIGAGKGTRIALMALGDRSLKEASRQRRHVEKSDRARAS